MSLKLIENIEEDLKLSVEDMIHVIRNLRKDVDSLKIQLNKFTEKETNEED